MKKKLIVLFVLLSLVLVAVGPGDVLAQVGVQGPGANACAGVGTGPTSGIKGAICEIGNILRMIVPLLILLGVIYFIWGVVSYVIASDEEAKKSGRDRIIYGIIGLAVIVSVWGLVGILTSTFKVDNTGNINLPTI
jgi:hypothetical protein